MGSKTRHFITRAQFWVRQDNYIQVSHPDTNRMIILVNEQADVFERIDEGLDLNDILEELNTIYDGLSWDQLQDIIDTLCRLELIAVADQFEQV